MKTVVIIFSDPLSGSDEALGRMFNGLFLTRALKDKRQDVTLLFQGAGARWPELLSKSDHPAHALYRSVTDQVIVCGGCADVFSATKGVEALGIPVVRERVMIGTTGVVDLSRYLDEGARLVTF